jgi:hypothetical protein
VRRLVDRLNPGFGYRELYIHTLSTLIAARPGLLHSTDRAVLRDRVEILLDSGVISAQAGRELDGGRHALGARAFRCGVRRGFPRYRDGAAVIDRRGEATSQSPLHASTMIAHHSVA